MIMGPWRWDPARGLLAIALILGGTGPAALRAADRNGAGQPALAPAEEPTDPSEAASQNVFSRPDRASVLRLTKARQLIDQGRYAEAVQHLGTILESSEDYFLPGNTVVRKSLRLEAQRLLGEMPRAGLELYELQYGARARQMLTEAAAAGDHEAVAEVARRFFHTRAGYEATLLLGLYHLDRASPLAGAWILQRLREVSPAADDFEPALSLSMATCWLRAGYPEKARQTLAQLKHRHPGATVEIGGKPQRLFDDDAQAVDWLKKFAGLAASGQGEEADGWAMAHGNPARNAAPRASGPLLSTQWRVSSAEDPYAEAAIEQLVRSPREQDRGTIPTLHPLVVQDTVLLRTVQNLLAVDLRTGKRLWEVPVDDPLEPLRAAPPGMPFGQPMPLEAALRYRIWGDATYGTLSSDGHRVFAVEDLGLDIGLSTARQFVNIPLSRNQAAPKPYNRLAAFDVRTGKLQWHLGGSPEEFGLDEAGTFFLGAPLPLMGRLYVLGESKGEIRLLALDAKTGRVLWRQQLAVAERDILSDPIRRLAGISPSYADGILICPTANRSIVALDLATQSLLWGYSYQQRTEQPQIHAMFPGFRPVLDPDPAGRWSDAHVMLADGCALATPPDSDRIHCLGLLDGNVLWTQPRDDDLYLAGVWNGQAILVGRCRVRALRVADGSPAWDGRTVELPPGSTPSGWGFLSADRYYLPLTSAEVMAIDLTAGKVDHVSRSRQGIVPGNLACFGDKVLSQSPGGVEVFFQLDALRQQVRDRLAANPEDAAALALRGEILWDEGNLAEAIASLRRSLEVAPDPRARALLRDAMFEGLRTDFATHRKAVEEIERLLDDPRHRATFLWLMASGCENAAEYQNAFRHYLELVDLDRGQHEMETVDKFLSVRRDRWIRVQLAALREAAPPEVRSEMDREVSRRLEAAAQAKSREGLSERLDYFGGLPVADQARRQWIGRLRQSGKLLPAEFLLREEERSAVRERAGAAVAQLALMFEEAGRHEEAAECFRRLADEFAGVVCLEGKTGRQWVESLAADSPTRRLLDPGPAWPTGEVLVEKSRPQRPPQETYSRTTVDYAGSPSPFFSDLAIELCQNPPQLAARDGLGNRRWQLSMVDMTRQGHFLFNRGSMRAVVRGHLLLIAMGQTIMAVDTLGTSGTGSPRVLWTHNLEEAPAALALGQQGRVLLANQAGGLRQVLLGGRGFPVNTAAAVPGVIHEQLVCFQRFRSCVAVDPLTGETLWVRQEVRPDSAVFGDDQYVFIAPPPDPSGSDPSPATVLRALDGKFLCHRQVPADRVATIGRYVLVWRETDTEARLELVDPWDNRQVWAPQKFAPHAKYCLVENEWVGVLEPGGRFVLLDAASGRTLVDAKVLPEQALSDIHVLRSPDEVVLVTNSAEREDSVLRRVYPMHGMASAPIVRGHVYAFDRQGKALWPAPVKVHDQFLLLAQPRRLPVVAFACMAQVQRPDNSNQHTTSILCIDRHTGRIVLREEFPQASNTFLLTGDLETKTVRLQLQRESITMTFTDKPLGPDSPPEGTINPAGGAKRPRPRNLWEALQRAAKGSVEKTFGLPGLDGQEGPADELGLPVETELPLNKPDKR